ncbi:VTT domain-containing protein [Silvimonas amylolytica]|uniref:Membrane protein n=1 Tax=Silvimonas amylolytica TaxID=449663 RepID=A0ABQ2PQT3_9NEIS|nr:VTT domain-containing protein [Silvimonas amylolytica]GGP27653.1 membrane protein [Silvimonas amylolytica]
MDLHLLLGLTQHYALPLTFLVTLVSRAGLPLPASPLLVMVGALSVASGEFALALLLAATLGGAMGDMVWFIAGRRLGRRVLGVICKVSLSADVCVRQSETLFVKWGGISLFAAKFVPGISAVAPPLAGALGWSWFSFLKWNIAASLFWSVVFLGLGALFSDELDLVLSVLAQLGEGAVWSLAALVVIYLVGRVIRRRRAAEQSDNMPRISVEQLRADLAAGRDPVIIDVRSAEGRLLDPRTLPGAYTISLREIGTAASILLPDRDIVVYCSCPNDVTAVAAARELRGMGWTRTLPLAGGLEAWFEAELPELLHPATPATT